MNSKDLPKCPIETTIMMLGCKWKILIIRELLTGTKRFNELKKSVKGITQKVLTTKLRQMEDLGLVERKIYPKTPYFSGKQACAAALPHFRLFLLKHFPYLIKK